MSLGITLGPWDPISGWDLFRNFFFSRLLLPILLLPSERKSRLPPRLWKESLLQNVSEEATSLRWLHKDSQEWERSMELLLRAMGAAGMSLYSHFLSDFQADPSFSTSI